MIICEGEIDDVIADREAGSIAQVGTQRESRAIARLWQGPCCRCFARITRRRDCHILGHQFNRGWRRIDDHHRECADDLVECIILTGVGDQGFTDGKQVTLLMGRSYGWNCRTVVSEHRAIPYPGKFAGTCRIF